MSRAFLITQIGVVRNAYRELNNYQKVSFNKNGQIIPDFSDCLFTNYDNMKISCHEFDI